MNHGEPFLRLRSGAISHDSPSQAPLLALHLLPASGQASKSAQCEKRASLSAASSPAKDVPLTDIQKLAIATFLIGHGKGKAHHDFAQRRAPSGAEDVLQLKRAIGHAAAGDRKTIQSFNPRGHRRVDSESFTTSSNIEFSSQSAPPSKNNGAAGSLFHTVSTKKLERSMSLPRAASPTKSDHKAFSMEGKRISCDSYLKMDIDQESPRISSSSTRQKIIDTTNMPETESEADLQSVEDSHPATEEPPCSGPVPMRRSCKTTAEIGIQIPPSSPHEEESGHEKYIAALFDEDDDDHVVTEEILNRDVTDKGVQCSLSSEEEEEYYSDASDESLVAVPSESNSSDKEAVPHAAIRKRRRSVSASGIGAMLLKVVQVADTAQSRGSPEKILFGGEALRARQYVLKKTAQFSMRPHAGVQRSSVSANSTPARACRPESEDPIKSTYSKFVDIEIDSGGHCIELVQHCTDAQVYGAASPFQARQRSRQATTESLPSPSHLHYQANTNCTTQQRSRQTTPGSCPIPSHLHYHTSSNYTQPRSRNATLESSLSPSHLHYPARSRQAIPGSSPSRSYILHHFSCPVHQRTPYDQTKDFSPSASPIKQTEEGRSPGKPTRDPSSRARIDPGSEKRSLQDCFKSVENADTCSTDKVNSRTIVSRLQAPLSGACPRVDVYRSAGASTVSILSSASISGSHQDRLWEEQADIYSSGGRGTPGRDEPEPHIIINLPKPPLRTNQGAEEVPRRRASPESGQFMQQFMSRMRGSMSPQRRTHRLPPRPGHALEKRKNTWSSCICFSVK